MPKVNKYNYLLVIQQKFDGLPWEDVSEYDRKTEYKEWKNDVREYRLMGYPTRTINRREVNPQFEPQFKIVIKKEFNPYTESWNPIAFIFDGCANPGRVTCYSHIGQHGEADINYMTDDCQPCEPELAQPLIEELRSIGYQI